MALLDLLVHLVLTALLAQLARQDQLVLPEV
jgi:hypothetical protein